MNGEILRSSILYKPKQEAVYIEACLLSDSEAYTAGRVFEEGDLSPNMSVNEGCVTKTVLGRRTTSRNM